MPNINAAVAWAIATANDNTHGYSQQNRLGPDYDCSSFVAAALIAGGFSVPPYMYTGIEYNVLIAAGFQTVPLGTPRLKGDIFMWDGPNNAGHTCICINSDYVVEAYGDYGHPETGDQTGLEITINPFDTGTAWQYQFRYPGASGRIPVWHAKNIGGYDKTSVEAQDNAVMIYFALSKYGWEINAVAGLLGNIGAESGYNPWIWEGNVRFASTDTGNPGMGNPNGNGYGLVQFTPSGNYCLSPIAQARPTFGPNWTDIPGNINDGTAQCEFIHITHAGAYISTQDYPETYDEFIISNKDADHLAADTSMVY